MAAPESGRDILLAGASGLVGSALARLLPAHRLITIGRSDVPGLPAGVQHITASPRDWAHQIVMLKPVIAISALGTTLRAAGSQAGFAAVDLTLVSAFAAVAKEAGARQFMMVSSVGAAAGSRNFYLSTKGKAEDAVRALGFERVDIARPGLLRGARTERRPGERIAMALSPVTDALTPAVLDQYRSIAAADVARALAGLCGANERGAFIHDNRAMKALSSAFAPGENL